MRWRSSVFPRGSLYEDTLVTNVDATDTIGWVHNRFFKNQMFAFDFDVLFEVNDDAPYTEHADDGARRWGDAAADDVVARINPPCQDTRAFVDDLVTSADWSGADATGLRNITNSCHMNAVLNAWFFHNPIMREVLRKASEQARRRSSSIQEG